MCVGDVAVPPIILASPDRLGTAERLLVDAGRRVGLDVTLLRYSHKRCQAGVDTGEVDALFLSAIPTNLAAYGFPRQGGGSLDAQRRATRVTVIWIKRARDDYDWNGQQLEGERPGMAVGVRSGFRMGRDAAEKLGFRAEESAANARQSLRQLQVGRVDAVLGIQQEYEAVLRMPEFKDLQVMTKPLAVVDYYAAVRRDLPPQQQSRADAWWHEIAKLRDTAPYRE